MRVEVMRNVDESWWNGMVGRSPHATIYQTANWMEFLREHFAADVRYLMCCDQAGEAVGVLAVAFTAPLVDRFIDWPGGRSVARFVRRAIPVVGWQRGPALFGPAELWPEATDRLLEGALRTAGRASVRRATLPLGLETVVSPETIARFRIHNWATYVIALNQSEEQLWGALKSSGRKCVRRARKDGITIQTVSGLEGRNAFQRFRAECLVRRGRSPGTARVLHVRHRHLSRIDGETIYVAIWNERPVASLGVFRFAGRICEFGAIQSQESIIRRLYGSDLLKWEIMVRERKRGMTSYDLAGVNPRPNSPKEEGIDQFKRKWGGVYSEYPVLQR